MPPLFSLATLHSSLRKVLCVGWHRTGTCSLGLAMRQLGYKHSAFNLRMTQRVRRGDPEPAINCARCYNSFGNFPWCLLAHEFDAAFPGTRYILTVRENSERWLHGLAIHDRRRGHNSGYRQAMTAIYGFARLADHEAEAVVVYERHNIATRLMFAGRLDFIELCWETGDGWPELCRFLGLPVVPGPFPYIHRDES